MRLIEQPMSAMGPYWITELACIYVSTQANGKLGSVSPSITSLSFSLCYLHCLVTSAQGRIHQKTLCRWVHCPLETVFMCCLHGRCPSSLQQQLRLEELLLWVEVGKAKSSELLPGQSCSLLWAMPCCPPLQTAVDILTAAPPTS